MVRKVKENNAGSCNISSSYSWTTSSTGSSDSRGESDDEKDTELRPADYWTCVKCKNKQNNPLYRYCERCYQVSFGSYLIGGKSKEGRKQKSSTECCD